jgi:anti-anti-sigma factor
LTLAVGFAILAAMDGEVLAVRAHDQDGVVTVRCVGEVDLSTCNRLREAADAAVDGGARRVLIDLTRVSFIDSNGLRCLLELQRRCELRAVSLIVEVAAGGPALRSFEMTGTDGKFNIHIGEPANRV